MAIGYIRYGSISSSWHTVQFWQLWLK